MAFKLVEKKLVRVFIGEEDKAPNGEPLFRYIVEWCLENGIAGATVFLGIMGYGMHKKLRKSGLLPSKKLPVVVEIVDESQKVEGKLLPFLKEVVKEGLVTVEKVFVLT